MTMHSGRAEFRVVASEAGWQALLYDRDQNPHPEISGVDEEPVTALARAVQAARHRKIPVPRIPVTRFGETRNRKRKMAANEG